MLVGIVMGPYFIGFFGEDIGMIHSYQYISKVALALVFLKAGLGLSIKDIKMSGKKAFRLGFIPATLEAVAIFAISFFVLK
jgi:NhaP-type Na+/H+ or K+/H+ antiporter